MLHSSDRPMSLRASAPHPLRLAALALALALGACAGTVPVAPTPSPASGTRVDAPDTGPTRAAPMHTAPSDADAGPDTALRPGILLMAHGGTDTWNDGVDAVARHLAGKYPTALAFGMADPVTLQAGLDSLSAEGVTGVAVVRMFLSGNSFRAQTEYLLGMTDTPPPFFVHHGSDHGGGHGDPAPVDHDLALVTHDEGLMRAHEASVILQERARALSAEPSRESVLVLAHGMGSEEENDRVLRAMAAATTGVRGLGFARVVTETLREDWPEARADAEARIRDFMASETEAGRRVLVLPFRLFGFGPYAEVLEGFDYVPGQGLLPHDGVKAWAARTAARLFCDAGWSTGSAACSGPVAAALQESGSR